MKISESKLRRVLVAAGQPAEEWSRDKLQSEANTLGVISSELDTPEDPDDRKTLARVLKKLNEGETITVSEDPADKKEKDVATATKAKKGKGGVKGSAVSRKVIYDPVADDLVEGDGPAAVFVGNFGEKQAKTLVGWRELEEGEDTDRPVLRLTLNGSKSRVVLDRNSSNRPFSLSLAEQYRDIMAEERWSGQKNSPGSTSNGESWLMGWDGQVISCAHRCVGLILACNEYGKDFTLPALVVSGIDPSSADTVDTGKNRKLGDILFRRREFKDRELSHASLKVLSRELSVAVRLVWLRSRGERVKAGSKLFHPEALSFLDEHPLLHDALLHVYHEEGGGGEGGSKLTRQGISLGYAGGLMYLMACSDGVGDGKPEAWDKAEEFWTLLASGEGLRKGDPVLTLRDVFASSQARKKEAGESLSRDSLCSLICKAWKAWIKGASLTPQQLKLKPKEVKGLIRVGGLDVEGMQEEEDSLDDE